MTRKKRSILLAALLLLCAPASYPAAASDVNGHEEAGGLSVFLGMLQAAAARTQPVGHRSVMVHSGSPRGSHAHHITVAVFDARTGERVEDARVDALVAPLGLGGTSLRLEPMAIADTVTYGNYFAMSPETYRIRLSISRAGSTRPVVVRFLHEHPRQ